MMSPCDARYSGDVDRCFCVMENERAEPFRCAHSPTLCCSCPLPRSHLSPHLAYIRDEVRVGPICDRIEHCASRRCAGSLISASALLCSVVCSSCVCVRVCSQCGRSELCAQEGSESR